MSSRLLAAVFACLAGGLASAQSAPPASQLGDQFSAPATARSIDYASTPRTAAGGSSSTFKFKSSAQQPPSAARPDPMAPAPVDLRSQIGPDGRPAIDCVRTPNDPKCR